MILLKDEIEIQTTPEELFNWLANLQDHYLEWHPDHVACKVLQGGGLEIGTVIYCEEFLHGKLHKIRFRITKVVPQTRFEYEMNPVMLGAFEVRPMEQRVRFIAEISFGNNWPIVGPLLDNILGRIFHKQIQALKIHMAEEGKNLKGILENNRETSRPNPFPAYSVG